MTHQNSSSLMFELNESIWLDHHARSAEIVSLSLEPIVEIDEDRGFVTIKGYLELQGRFETEEDEDDTLDLESSSLAKQLQYEPFKVEQKEIYQREYKGKIEKRFPLDITLPAEKVKDLKEVYVNINQFDYSITDQHRLNIEAGIEILGITVEENKDLLLSKKGEELRAEPLTPSFQVTATRAEAEKEEELREQGIKDEGSHNSTLDSLVKQQSEEQVKAVGEKAREKVTMREDKQAYEHNTVENKSDFSLEQQVREALQPEDSQGTEQDLTQDTVHGTEQLNVIQEQKEPSQQRGTVHQEEAQQLETKGNQEIRQKEELNQNQVAAQQQEARQEQVAPLQELKHDLNVGQEEERSHPERELQKQESAQEQETPPEPLREMADPEGNQEVDQGETPVDSAPLRGQEESTLVTAEEVKTFDYLGNLTRKASTKEAIENGNQVKDTSIDLSEQGSELERYTQTESQEIKMSFYSSPSDNFRSEQEVEEEHEQKIEQESISPFFSQLMSGKEEQKNEVTRLKMCIIQKDESLEEIANRYELRVTEIMRYNRLETQEIKSGQILYIPKS